MLLFCLLFWIGSHMNAFIVKENVNYSSSTASVASPEMMQSRDRRECRKIYPGSRWVDTRGRPIHAHGGQMIYPKSFVKSRYFPKQTLNHSLYYWVGESEKSIFGSGGASVLLYSSPDLITWKWEGSIFSDSMIPPELGISIIERPKIIEINSGRNTVFVLVFHADDANYQKASIGYATSTNSIHGPYTFQRIAQPDGGNESRDLGIYFEDHTSNHGSRDHDYERNIINNVYLLYASQANTKIVISKLLVNDTSVSNLCATIGLHTRIVSEIDGSYEAPTIVKVSNGYILFVSFTTWWFPNSGAQFFSTSLQGPWERIASLVPWYKFLSQPTYVFPIPHNDNWIYMSDRWFWPFLSWASYVWIPIKQTPHQSADSVSDSVSNSLLDLPKPIDLSWRSEWCLNEVF